MTLGTGMGAALCRLVASARPHRRVAPRANLVGDRLHVQLRRVWPDQAGPFLAALTDVLADLPVAWFDARLLDATLVVALDDGASEQEVVDAIETAEVRAGIDVNPFPEHRHGAPVEDEPLLRAAAEVAADVFGFGLTVTLRALRVPPPPFEVDVEGIVALVQNVPGLRRTLGRWIGRASAEATAGVAAALAAGLTQNPLSPILGCAYHSLRLSELRVRQDAWLAAEPQLYGPGGVTACSSETAERPVPRPPGPIERYAEFTWVASLGTFVAMLPLVGSVERALSVLSSGAPKAARLGREAFGSHLATDLGRRGIVVVRPGTLRLLDQVDVAVVEGRLWTGQDAAVLGRVAAANELDLVVVGAPPRRGIQRSGRPSPPARVVPAGHGASEVRRLQIAGHVVATVGGPSFDALASGDVPIGVANEDGHSPDGSHVICRSGLGDAARVLGASGAARQASRESARLSLAGAVAGAVLAIAPPVGGRPRVLMAVDAAALVAVGNAVRHAHEATVASFRPESVPATGSAPVPLRTAAGNG
jgi:cation-transporting ATPase I